MMLTIHTLFNDPNIVNAVIQRVLKTRKDTIYWQQYLGFRRTTTRVFKDYIGQVTGVMAGSINSRYGEKPIRERRNIGSGYGEIAYLGDRYQISIDRLSDLQDLIDKYNAAKPEDQKAAMRDIVDFIYDDYRQVLLAPHKRMDIIVGSLLMTGAASVKNKDDNAGGIDLLNIDLPFKFIKPDTEDKDYFVTYLQQKLNELKSIYGTFPKMIMSRGTFIKNIIGSSEFGDKFKMKDMEIYITKRSYNLQSEFRKYVWAKDKDGNYINEPEDHDNHGIDAVRYYILGELLGKIQKPKDLTGIFTH